MNFANSLPAPPTAALAVCAILVSLLTLAAAEATDVVHAVAGLLFLFALLLALHRFKYGVWLCVLLLPLSASRIVPREMLGVTGLNPFNLTLLLTLTMIGLARVLRPDRLRLPAIARPLLLYLACLVLATFNGLQHVTAIPSYFYGLQVIPFNSAIGYVLEVLIKPLLILTSAYLLAVGVANVRRPQMFLVPLFASAIVLPLLLIAQILITGVPLSSMVAGGESFSGVHVNELGLMFNMAFALTLFSFFSRGAGRMRWWLGLVLLILVTGIALTFSRGAYLGFLTVLLFFLYRKRRFDFMLAGLAVLPLAIMLLPQAVMQRAATGLGNGDVDTISAGRINEIWRPLLPELTTSPVVGQGLSSVLWSEPAHSDNFFMVARIGHPHSAYLGMLLDFGIIGAVAICLFFVHLWRSFALLARRHPDPLWRDFFSGASACILVLMIQGVTDDRVTPTVEQSNLWLAYGLAIGMLARRVAPARAHGSAAWLPDAPDAMSPTGTTPAPDPAPAAGLSVLPRATRSGGPAPTAG